VRREQREEKRLLREKRFAEKALRHEEAILRKILSSREKLKTVLKAEMRREIPRVG
jgi:hypothetical protein